MTGCIMRRTFRAWCTAPVRFDPETRRVKDPRMIEVEVQNGKFVLWNGNKS